MRIVYLDVMGPSLDPSVAALSRWSHEVAHMQRRRFRDHLVSSEFSSRDELVILRVNPGDQSDSLSVFEGIESRSIDHLAPGGRDIGALRGAAAVLPPDELTVFVGSSCYPVASNWISRFQEAWDTHTPGALAPFASLEVNPHLRTACFATEPRLLLAYPFAQDSEQEYYRFEHGPDNFSLWLESRGYVPVQVTREQVVPMRSCRRVRNGYRRGDQSQLLIRDRHSDAYMQATLRQRLDMRMRARGVEMMAARTFTRRVRSRLFS